MNKLNSIKKSGNNRKLIIFILVFLLLSSLTVSALVPILNPDEIGFGANTRSQNYDDLVNALYKNGRVVQSIDGKMWVPWYKTASGCEQSDLQSKKSCNLGSINFENNCMVTDEFSQVGVLVSMGSNQGRMDEFYNTVNAIASDNGILPGWRLARKEKEILTCAPKLNGNCDTASDASARIITALWAGAKNPNFNDEAKKQEYSNLANQLAEDMYNFEIEKTCMPTKYGSVCHWLAGGSDVRRGGFSSRNYVFTGYFGDVIIALLQSCAMTGKNKFCEAAEDLSLNYLQAAKFNGKSFTAPPGMAFNWAIEDGVMTAKCTQACNPIMWDGFDAPRATTICQSNYHAKQMGLNFQDLDNYCKLWGQRHMENAKKAPVQYSPDGASNGLISGYYAQGLQSQFHMGYDLELFKDSLDSALGHFSKNTGTWDNEPCFGIYTKMFAARSLGVGIGRDINTFKKVSYEPKYAAPIENIYVPDAPFAKEINNQLPANQEQQPRQQLQQPNQPSLQDQQPQQPQEHIITKEPRQESFYLNLDLLNLKQQSVLFDIFDVKSELNPDEKIIDIEVEYNIDPTYTIALPTQPYVRDVIDLSVRKTAFNWKVNKEKICTRWEIYSIEDNKFSNVCYGDNNCCSFINLESFREDWDDALYLTKGLHGATDNNIISAQVIYVDYNISIENPFSDIHYSSWKSSSASFTEIINVINSISIERALDHLDALLKDNILINKIDIVEGKGEKPLNLTSEKNVSLVINISKEPEKIFTSAKESEEEIIVSINNFNALEADWDNTPSINISTENEELSASLKEIGINPKKIVNVKGIDGFLSNESYYGSVKLSISSPFTRVIYCSDGKIFSCRSVDACVGAFNGKECYVQNESILTVYVPHFSSIVVAYGNATANLTLFGPDNSTSLDSGENVYLNFTINETVTANFSLDGNPQISLGTGDSFSALLQGDYPYGVLKNGKHNLSLYIKEVSEIGPSISYDFIVSDVTAPKVNVNITNHSVFTGSYQSLSLNLSYIGEHAYASFWINGISQSGIIDLTPSNSVIANAIPIIGKNNLTLVSYDLHDNQRFDNYEFTFTEQIFPTCSDASKNQDETGVDCGGTCNACIKFNTTTDRLKYNLTDIIYLSVISRQNSLVNVTIKKNEDISARYTFAPVFGGAPISETRIIANSTDAANYTVNSTMHYLNITEYINFTFEVVPPSDDSISVTIIANDTKLIGGGDVSFNSVVSGNKTTVNYNWDIGNDGSIESNRNSLNYTFTNNGTYIVNLTVIDGDRRQTDIEKIIVEKLFDITIKVYDNETGSLIQEALVEFDDNKKNTSSDGSSLFRKTEGKYNLVVRKYGYGTFSNKTTVKDSKTVEVRLLKYDQDAPIVGLTFPKEDFSTPESSIDFIFLASDSGQLTCRINIYSNSNIWKIKELEGKVEPNIAATVKVDGFVNGTYEWNVECRDGMGNLNKTSFRTFFVDTSIVENTLSVDLEQQDLSMLSIKSQIEKAIKGLSSFSQEENEVAESMQLKKKLERADLEIERANRDLHSLKWRKLNDTELELETNNILNKIEEIKQNTPRRLEIVDSNEFVNYPTKDDIGKMLDIIINSTNLKFSKKEIKKLIDLNHKIQSELIVTTKSKTVNLESLSGKKDVLTIITKSVSGEISNGNLGYYEVIPKKIAKNISEIEFLFDYAVIEQDPIVEIDINKIKKYSYYVYKRVDASSSEQIKSILIDKGLKIESGKGITGFAIIGKLSSSITETTDIRLIIEFAIVIILLVVFVYYQFGGADTFSHLLEGRDVKDLRALIDLALVDVKNSNYDASSKKYKQINANFKALDKKKKDVIKTSVIELLHKVNLLFINQLSIKADDHIKENDKKGAFVIYKQIQGLYKIIPKNYKAEVSKKCLEIHSKLSSK